MDAVDGNGAHLETGHIRGNGRIDSLAWKNGISKLLTAAYVSNRCVRGGNIAALLRVQSERSLQGVIIEKGAGAGRVLGDPETNFQFSAFSCYLIGGAFLPVQIVAQGDVPR